MKYSDLTAGKYFFLAKLALKWTQLFTGCLKNFLEGEMVGVEVRNLKVVQNSAI